MMSLNLPERIETDRLVLQRLRYEDAEEMFYGYASKPEATRYVAWPTHQSVQETRRFLDYAISAWDGGSEYTFSIRIKETNWFIGSIGVVNDSGKVSFGYILGPNHWSKGYTTEACSAVLQHLRLLREVYRVWTLVDTDNTASCKVLEKCGLIREAQLYKWFRFINQNNQPKDCFIYRLPERGS